VKFFVNKEVKHPPVIIAMSFPVISGSQKISEHVMQMDNIFIADRLIFESGADYSHNTGMKRQQ